MRGAGGARARASQAGWCLCASSVQRVRVFLREFTNPHTNTQKSTARAAENALESTHIEVLDNLRKHGIPKISRFFSAWAACFVIFMGCF